MADYAVGFVTNEYFTHLPDSIDFTHLSIYDGAPIPDPKDLTPPQVTNLSPAIGTVLLPTDSISFDVTDNLGLFTRIIIVAWFRSTGIQEVIHDGDGFTGYYTSTSSRVLISGGYRYIVNRFSGWVSAPTIRIFSIDNDGNEA